MGKEGTPTWNNIHQMKLHVPPVFIVWYLYGGGPCKGGGKAVLSKLK